MEIVEENVFNGLYSFSNPVSTVCEFIHTERGTQTVFGIVAWAAHRVLMTMPVKQALLHEWEKTLKTKSRCFYSVSNVIQLSKQFLTKTAQQLFQIKSGKHLKWIHK